LTASSAVFAQAPSSGYNVYDSSVIAKKHLPQHNEFINNMYNFPARPKDMWEIGVSVGNFALSSDVAPLLPTFGFGVHARKSLGYAFSIRMQYMYGVAKGLANTPTVNFGKNTAWAGYPTGAGNVVYANYKNRTQDLGIQGILSINNIRFHKHKSKVVLYAGAGIGLSAYQTKVNALNEASGTNYRTLFNNTYTDFGNKRENYKQIRSTLKGGMDNTYETDAESHSNRRKIGGQTIAFSSTILAGVAYRLSNRMNLAIESRHTFVGDDLLDGQRWQEHPQGDAALSPNFDTYNYTSIGLNYNLGKKAIEPLWWINPLDYVYGELNNPKHTKFPKPSFEDADGDGVIDQIDREPNTPAGAKVDPTGVAADTDGDGIPDYKDKQLITPSDCMPVDADGVGKCPEPECCKNMVAGGNKGGVDNACPSDYPTLSFKGNSGATLSAAVKSMLSNVASKLKANPSCNVTVTGYPEASKASQALCQKRTEAIKNYLVQNMGIVADRVSTNCEIGGGDKDAIDIKAD
jgi:outer membrane protein OmpA-like peptidoglycan-associated protein